MNGSTQYLAFQWKSVINQLNHIAAMLINEAVVDLDGERKVLIKHTIKIRYITIHSCGNRRQILNIEQPCIK